MKAMILAAGRGERMRPLTDSTPKPLLEVGGKPLIVWHIQRLKQAGFDEIVINHAWLGQQIEDTLGDGAQWGVKIAYSAEGSTGFETAGGIATALDLLGNQPFLVINGDVLTNIDFQIARQYAERLLQNQQLAHLWLVPNPEHNLKGDFSLLNNHFISENLDLGQTGTFSGVGVYSPTLFKNLPKKQVIKLAPLLREAMKLHQVSGIWHDGLWLDVGTVERLQEANQLIHQYYS